MPADLKERMLKSISFQQSQCLLQTAHAMFPSKRQKKQTERFIEVNTMGIIDYLIILAGWGIGAAVLFNMIKETIKK